MMVMSRPVVEVPRLMMVMVMVDGPRTMEVTRPMVVVVVPRPVMVMVAGSMMVMILHAFD